MGKVRLLALAMCLSALAAQVRADPPRVPATGVLHLSADSPDGSSVSLSPGDSALVRLEGGDRFFQGVEVTFSAPQAWFAHSGSLAVIMYADLEDTAGVASGRRIGFELLPGRIHTVYRIPVRHAHGLRSGPYATVPSDVTPPSSFPVLFRLAPVVRDLDAELAEMSFLVSARPILSDEGAVRITARYPEQLRGRPFTVLINDMVVDIAGEHVLREGEHHLVVVSEHYRNESRRFVVERSRTVDLVIELQDPTPLIFFEAPANTQIFLNNSPIFRGNDPIPVEPGVHEARFHVGDYTITRTITVQRGKTYRIALTVDIDIEESD